MGNNNKMFYIILVLLLVVGGGLFAYFYQKNITVDDTVVVDENIGDDDGKLTGEEILFNPEAIPPMKADSEKEGYKIADLDFYDEDYTFTVSIPDFWELEFIPEPEPAGLNFYDPTIPKDQVTDRPRIFVRKAHMTSFGIDGRLEVLNEEKQIFQGKEAILYEVNKKADQENFQNQPDWRNRQHKVLVVKVNDRGLYYRIAYNPKAEAEYKTFLDLFKFDEEE